jgi:hypothetical protein
MLYCTCTVNMTHAQVLGGYSNVDMRETDGIEICNFGGVK